MAVIVVQAGDSGSLNCPGVSPSIVSLRSQDNCLHVYKSIPKELSIQEGEISCISRQLCASVASHEDTGHGENYRLSFWDVLCKEGDIFRAR